MTKFKLILIVCLVFNLAFVNAQSNSGSIKLVKVFNPNKDASSMQFSLNNLESPYPNGEGYRAAVLNWKEKLAKKYPKVSPEIDQMKRASVPNPVVFKSWVPQQGFSVKAPIPGGTPSDNTLAVSDNGYLITSWNSEIYAHDLNSDTAMFNVGLFRPTISFSEFSPITLNSPFDPKLRYDPINERFILVFLSGRDPSDSKIIVGFSSTSNPTDNWYVYELDGAPLASNTWTDYPAIAMNENELFLTINLVIVGEPWQTGFDQTLIWQMDKQAAYNGAAALPNKMWQDVQFNNKNLRYLCPVQNGEIPEGDEMHFISNRNYPPINDSLVFNNDSIFLVTIKGNIANNPTIDVKHITSPIPYITPPDAAQSNTQDFDTNDGRVLGAVRIDNTIQFVASSRDNTSGYPIVFHGLIDDFDNSTPTMRANLITHPYLEMGYPNLVYVGSSSGSQDVVIGFNHTADTVFSGHSVIYYNGDTDGYSDIVQVKRGLNSVDMLGGATERWGDYYGIQRKYNEPGKLFTAAYWSLLNQNNSISFEEITTKNFEFTSTENIKIKEVQGYLFPNPTGSSPFVSFEFNSLGEQTEISVIDITGKVIQPLLSDYVKKGINKIQFSTESLNVGIYFVTINKNSSGNISFKFVVN